MVRKPVKPKRKSLWTVPDDMPKEQAEKVLAGLMCGAKKKSSPGYCIRKPLKEKKGGNRDRIPYRCDLHGGAAGAPKGNTNGFKHGIYGDCMFPNELAYYEEIMKNPLDLSQEIANAKIRLRRALKAKCKQLVEIGAGTSAEILKAMRLNRKKVEWGISEKGPIDKETTEKKLVNYDRAINTIINQLVRLTDSQKQAKGSSTTSVKDRAKLINEELAELAEQFGM